MPELEITDNHFATCGALCGAVTSGLLVCFLQNGFLLQLSPPFCVITIGIVGGVSCSATNAERNSSLVLTPVQDVAKWPPGLPLFPRKAGCSGICAPSAFYGLSLAPCF